MASQSFRFALFLTQTILAGIGFSSKSFCGPMIFDSFEEAIRQLLTGRNVFPSLHPSVRRRKPFLLAEVLNFQGTTHLIGVGSLSE